MGEYKYDIDKFLLPYEKLTSKSLFQWCQLREAKLWLQGQMYVHIRNEYQYHCLCNKNLKS